MSRHELIDISLAEHIKGDLEAYTPGGLERALGSDAMKAVSREQRIPALLAARASDDPVAVLARLFLLGDAVSPEEVARALPSVTLDELVAGGILTTEVRARFTITPHDVDGETILIASDWGALAGVSPGDDFVMPVGKATRTLGNIARYGRGDRVLDLGTGAGWHAIMAARAGANVVATDISERALSFARFNAALAGVEIETRCGSLFEPVTEQFDVIVSNPPFVLTPQGVRDVVGSLEYRDGGDAILIKVLSSIDEYLAPTGRAWLLGNWEVTDRHSQPLEPYLSRNSWVIVRDTIDPASYVEMWLRDGGLVSGETYEKAYTAWLDDFTSRNVREIAFGYILIGGPGSWRKFDELPGQITEGFDVQDRVWANAWIDQASDDEFLACYMSQQGLIEQRYHTPGVEAPWHLTLSGDGRQYAASGELAGFIGACDGSLTGAQIMGALSQILGQSEDELAASIMPTLRLLASDGALVLSGHNSI